MNVFAISAAFSTYFCMYAFRKPLTAGTYEGILPWGAGVQLKTAFLISQILGYTLSKYLGTRVLSELDQEKRPHTIVGLIVASWTALLAFAMGGAWVQMLSVFLNGLCLGMIWGLVVSFLEGRRTSELLLAGLSCSFIVASGAVKDVGRWTMRAFGTPEEWMPFLTGGLFILPLLVSVIALAQIPAPSRLDQKERTIRTTMTKRDRAAFVRKNGLPLALILVVYFFLTAFRDYRDNYGVEIFAELGYKSEPALFTRTELPVAFFVMVILALLSLVRQNRRALALMFVVMTAGLLMLGGATMALRAGEISGITWMTLVGLGSYLTYVPFGSMLFERIVAHTRTVGTAVFGIYLADALGYTGSVLVQLYADLFSKDSTRLEFFFQLTQGMSFLGAALLAVSGMLWLRAGPKPRTSAQ